MRPTKQTSTSTRGHAYPDGQFSGRRPLVASLALALSIGMLAFPVAARHDDGYSPIVPWHHERGVTVTAGVPADFGSRWGACTDRLARAARKGLDVTVTVDGEEAPPAGWSAPVRPTKRIGSDNFRRQCLSKPDSPRGSWIFSRAPVTFESPGTHRVGVTMTANRRVDDGADGVLPRGWSISEEITVIVEDPPPAGAFAQAGTLTQPRSGHTATLLPDGRVLITGGEGLEPEDLATAEVWDPASATFGPAKGLTEPRHEPLVEAELERTGQTATLLPDGRALVIGGTADGALTATAEILDPESGELATAGTLAEPRAGHTATFLRDGRVLVVGGSGPDGPLASAEVWTPARKPAMCLGQRPTLIAQPGMELMGSKGGDVIAGSVGDDIIRGGPGNDRICGNGGADILDGGAGNDVIDGGPGADMVTGGGGKDRLAGAAGDDTLDGGKGKDVCIGGKGTDWLPGCNEAKRTRGTVIVNKNLKLKGPHVGRFEIGKNGVTLDCDGHTVSGPGREALISAIRLVGRNGATVRNCDIRGHFHGIWLEGSDRNKILSNRVSRSAQAFTLIFDSDGNRLVGNAADDAIDFAYGVYEGSDKNVLRGNLATRAGVAGFSVNTGKANVFTDNVSKDGTGVIRTQDASKPAGGFETTRGTTHGFTADSGAVNNTFTGNSSVDNNGNGFIDTTEGFRGDAGTDNHYEDNTCSGNSRSDSQPPTLCE